MPPDATFDHSPLNLKAVDVEDVHAVSAYLQDALVPFTSLEHDAESQTFRFLAHRFCWEALYENNDHGAEPNEKQVFYRVDSLVTLTNVETVESYTMENASRLNHPLNVLAVRLCEDGSIALLFTEGCLRLVGKKTLHLHMEDTGQRWPTDNLPHHLLDAEQPH